MAQQLDSLRVRWVEATGYLNPPQARCGHVAAAINSREVWGEEFLIVHGGINRHKEALDDLVVLQYDQEAWFQPGPAAVGPAARAFHAGCAIGRKLYIFGGHVYVKQQHKLHQFNDLWVLNTDNWEWGRVEVSPDAPQPCPRDRAAMVALGPSRLLLYGGADAMNRRLDDLWLFDLDLGTWQELRPGGAKPRARCCTALVAVENRVLMFAGDSYGVTSELWSLRGVMEGDGESAAQWTHLTLEGPAPPPRRGHASAALGRWVVFMGGLTEQKSMLGIKSRNEYLADVVVLDRQVDRVAWRGIEAAAAGEGGPLPREKHTLTALSGGRLLMFGGTDGQTTLGDAWWLDLEDIATPTPHTLTPGELPQAGGPFVRTPEEVSQQYQEQYRAVQQHQQQQYQGGTINPLLAAQQGAQQADSMGAAVLAQQGAQQAQQGAAQAPPASGSFPYLPAALTSSLPAVPAGLSNAFTSFRERLGLPATASSSSLASASTTAAAAAAAAGGAGPAGAGAAAAGAPGGAALRYGGFGGGAGGALPPPVAYLAAAGAGFAAPAALPAPVDPTRDEGLLSLGQRTLLSTLGEEGGGVEGGGWEPAQLVDAARHFLAACRPEELRLGELPVLMADYRRLARVGWAQAVQQQGGLEALLSGGSRGGGAGEATGEGEGVGGGDGGELLLRMPGRFLHLAAEDLRMREIPEVLADYQLLLASQTPDLEEEE